MLTFSIQRSTKQNAIIKNVVPDTLQCSMGIEEDFMSSTRVQIETSIKTFEATSAYANTLLGRLNNNDYSLIELTRLKADYLTDVGPLKYFFKNQSDFIRYGINFEINQELIHKIITTHISIADKGTFNKELHRQESVALLNVVIKEINSLIETYKNQLMNLDQVKSPSGQQEVKPEHNVLEQKQEIIPLKELQRFYEKLNKICRDAAKRYASKRHDRAPARRDHIDGLTNLTVKLVSFGVLIRVQDLKNIVEQHIEDFIISKNNEKKSFFKAKETFNRQMFLELGTSHQYATLLKTLYSTIDQFDKKINSQNVPGAGPGKKA